MPTIVNKPAKIATNLKNVLMFEGLAERVGFEPTVEFPRHSLSRRALSTAQTPLRGCSALSLTKGRNRHNYSRETECSQSNASVHFESDVHVLAVALYL